MITKRRKGKKRPPTVCNNCRYIMYDRCFPLCFLKIKIMNENESFKRPNRFGMKKRMMCSKTENCGFEEKNNKNCLS